MMKTNKIQKSIYPIVNTVIRAILLLITAGLCMQSMFSTSFIGRITREDGSLQERTLNIADDPWKHLLVFLVFTVLGCLFCYIQNRAVAPDGFCNRICCVFNMRVRDGNSMDSSTKDSENAGKTHTSGHNGNSRALWILSGIVLLMGTAWILITQLVPGSDPAKVYGVAMQWRRGDFSSYAEGGYLFRYPFQAGIVLFYYLLSFLFGVDNYIGVQMVNVIALLAVYMLLVKLSALFWKKDRKLPVIVYIALVLWVPLAFYITYLYGILPGMALSLGAVYSAAKYIDTRKYRYIVPACICMGLATVIKMNCLIYLIAVACFLFYDALDIAFVSRKEPWKRCVVSLALIALMGLSVIGCNRAVERYVEHLSGYEAGDGEAMISWVVMGLQETPLGPGGYSGYIAEVFLENDYDTEKIQEASAAEIRKILTRMSDNMLDDGIPFFARKNAFQWNDPTFISLDRTRGRASGTDLPAFVVSLIEGKGSVVISVMLNYAQTLLLFGVLLYLLFHRRSENLYELIGAVVFLGGYLFHFVWESSASYTIPYFVVLIPYAVKGLADWIRYSARIPVYIRNCRSGKEGIRNLLRDNRMAACGCIMAAVLIVLFMGTNLFDRTIALDDGEEARAQFYHEDAAMAGFLENARNAAYMAGIRDGYYYLSPYTAPDSIVVEEEGKTKIMTGVSGISGMAGTAEGAAKNAYGGQGTVSVPAVEDIGHKILFNSVKDSGSAARPSGIIIRFRSNEQVLAAVTREGETRLAVYMDDGMNLFYEPDADVAYRWKVRGATDGGYYITINGLALTFRNGELTLEELTESKEQRWVLRQ